MTTPKESPQAPKNYPLLILGCLAFMLCLGITLIGISAVSLVPLIRAPLQTILAPQLTENHDPLTEPTQAAGFQPTRAPHSGPTQAPAPLPVFPLSFADDFSWNSFNWFIGEADNDFWRGKWTIARGKYRIDLTALQGFITWQYLPSSHQTDSDISVAMKMVEASGAAEGGLILRGTDKNYYVFMVSPVEKFWYFGLLYNSEWITLAEWTYSEAIQTDGENEIRVFAQGSTFELFINNISVGKVIDTHLKAGSAGVVVQAEEDISGIYEFDNFMLYAPAPGPAEAGERPSESELSAQELLGVEGKIIFATSQNGNYDLYSANPNGSDLARLSDSAADDYAPDFSPDGKKIAFVSNRDGNSEIYRMNTDGSEVIRLTSDPAEDSSPAWSPDGSQIAFVTWRDGDAELYLMDSNGENLLRLTEHPALDYSPAWSPDGSKIAFLSDRENEVDIFILNIERGQILRFSYSPFTGSEGLSWSPDGEQIIFVSRKSGNAEIYARDVVTKDETQLTDHPFEDLFPSWSTNGDYITFVSLRDNNYEIYVLRASDRRIIRLTDRPAKDTTPSWGVQR